MVSRGSKQRRWNKDYQQLTVQWRRRGGCGVRRRSRCADWSAGFGPSIARPRRPAVSGYAGRLSYPEGGWHQRCYGRYSRVEMGASLGERTCDVEITPTGPLSELKIPKVPGLETFRGKVFHSARWMPTMTCATGESLWSALGFGRPVCSPDPADGRLPHPVSAHCGVGLAARRAAHP